MNFGLRLHKGNQCAQSAAKPIIHDTIVRSTHTEIVESNQIMNWSKMEWWTFVQ